MWGKKYQLDLKEETQKETSDYITAKMSDCYKSNESSECYKRNAEDFINRFELSEIMNVFDRNEKSSEFFDKCHLTSHYLGQEKYKRVKNIQKVFEESSRACLGGTYHGAVEGYFMYKNISYEDETLIKKEVNTICGKPEDHKRPQDFTECNHGLGHAVMYITKNDLLKALDLCDALLSKNEQALCYTGALMANGDSFGSTDHPTKYIKTDDPLYPCPILKKQQQEQCYTYGVLTRFQFDIPKSISLCLKVPVEFQHQCFKTFGRDRTMLSLDPTELKSQCYQIKQEEYRKDCVSGTSYNLVIRFGASSSIPAEYCKITETKYKDNCYAEIFSALKNITKDSEVVKNFCGKISEDSYRNKCLN